MSAPAPRVVWPQRLAHALEGRGRYVLAFLLFVGATIAVFAPLIGNLHSAVLTAESTDARNAIRGMWLVQHLHSTPFTLSRDPLNGAPEGTPLIPAVAIASPFQPFFMWVLAPITGLVASLNLFLLSGFVATAFAAFVLFDRLGFTFLPSIIGGYVVAFNPWAIERAVSGAPAFNHGWCLILLLLALIRLLRRPTYRSAALAGAAYGVCFLVAAYFGLIGFAFIVAYTAIAAAHNRGWTGWTATAKRLGVAAATTVVPLLPALVVTAHDRRLVAQSLTNPVSQLTQLGASPFASYFLPARRHPFLGNLARSLRPTDPLREKVLFLGYVTAVLAVVGIVALVRRARLSPLQRTAMTIASVTLPIAFVFSLPRSFNVFGATLYTPTYVFGVVTSFYRVYARVAYAAEIAAALLAVATLTLLERRPRGRVVVVGLGLLIVLEFLPGSLAVTAVNKAPRYDAWLARQPKGIVAHYPLPTDNELALILEGDEYYNQRFTAQPDFNLFGAGIGGTREEGIRLLARYITGPLTPRILTAEGVRYVVVHDDIYRRLHEEPPGLGPPFQRAATFGDVRIYLLRPHPNPHLLDKLLIANAATLAALEGLPLGTVTVGPGGFNEPERYHHVFGWHWMTQNGTLQVDNPYDHPMKFRLMGHAFSNGVPRTVEIQSDTGKKVTTFHVAIYETGLRVQPFVLQPGVTTLNLFATPDPQDLGAARMGSIFLSPVHAVPLSQVSVRAK